MKNNKQVLETIEVGDNEMLKWVVQQVKETFVPFKQITFLLWKHRITWEHATNKLTVTLRDGFDLEPLSLDAIKLETLEAMHEWEWTHSLSHNWINLIEKNKMNVKNIMLKGHTRDGIDIAKAVLGYVNVLGECGNLEKLVVGIDVNFMEKSLIRSEFKKKWSII